MTDTENRKPVPGGIENFQKLRRGNFYYVDKTALICELLRRPWEVTLFTRPRRFGKTLMLDTIRSFLELGAEPSDFDGLEIERETALYQKHFGQYPVIFLTLKEVEGRTYRDALNRLRKTVCREMSRLASRMDAERLSLKQRQLLDLLTDWDMPETALQDSLRDMSELLYRYYGQNVIILIDEYDVPLDKAFHAKEPYYEEMVSFLRGFLGSALKTNPTLKFAVLTGCLRIAKESIFTGLNNFRVMTTSKAEYSDSFGFTEPEVRDMLDYYGLGNYYDSVQDWYDGYLFGNHKVFCPWDVLNYVADSRTNPGGPPDNYWVNSSGNEIVRRLIRTTHGAGKIDLERLMAGEALRKTLREELTYGDIYKSTENIWSVLYVTGYLTRAGTPAEDGTVPLRIPNREIRQVFERQIWEWFRDETQKDPAQLSSFCQAIAYGDAETTETLFGNYTRAQ